MGESELLEPAGQTELEGCLKAQKMLNIGHSILLFSNFNSRKTWRTHVSLYLLREYLLSMFS